MMEGATADNFSKNISFAYLLKPSFCSDIAETFLLALIGCFLLGGVFMQLVLAALGKGRGAS